MLMTSQNKHTVDCEDYTGLRKAMRYVILKKSSKWKTLSGLVNNEYHV